MKRCLFVKGHYFYLTNRFPNLKKSENHSIWSPTFQNPFEEKHSDLFYTVDKKKAELRSLQRKIK